MFNKIIWATDGSAESDSALEELRKIVVNGTQVVAVHVDEMFVGPHAYGVGVRVDEDERKAKIRGQVAELEKQGYNARAEIVDTRSGIAAQAIAHAAEREGADLIVVGARRRSAMGSLLLGSVTQRLIQETPCPILVVPEER